MAAKPEYALDFFVVTFPEPSIAHVELNRPEKLNAFRHPMWEHLDIIFKRLSTDPDVRVVVLSGRGERGFTAGLDVQESSSPITNPKAYPDPARAAFAMRKYILDLQATVTAIEECAKPVICVMHGYSFGLAVDVGSACDIRYAAKDTKFSVKEAAIGLAADIGTLTRLPKLGCSMSWVKDIAYSARTFGAEEAMRQGFVSEVAATKDAAVKLALATARAIAQHSPVAVQGTKRNIDYSRDHSIRDGLEYTATWNAAMLQTDDVTKALTSGLKKISPTFAKL